MSAGGSANVGQDHTGLVGFLTARYDEDQWYADNELTDVRGPGTPDRVRADVDAKRRIITEHAPVMPGWCGTCDVPADVKGNAAGCLTLRLLAVPYASHPDYRPEWSPDAHLP